MKLMHSEWKDRIGHWIRTLKDDFYEPLGEITWEAFETMEQLTYEEALSGRFAPVKEGFTWGREWEYCWFKGSIILPERAAGERIVLDLKPDGVRGREGFRDLPCIVGERAPPLCGGQRADPLRKGGGAL